MEPLRGAWCQFWVKVAPAQTLHTDCSELGFHKSVFGLRSVFHSCPVLCVTSIIGQNKNPSSEQPLAGGKGTRSAEPLGFVASVGLCGEVSNKRWRSTMSPYFILADSPISLIIMNQGKGNLLRRKPLIYAVQSLMLLPGEVLWSPILYNFPTKNFSVWRHCVCTCFFLLGFWCLRRCRAGENILHHFWVAFKLTTIPHKYSPAWDSSRDQYRWSRARY